MDLLHKDTNVTSSKLDTLTDEANLLELSVQDLIQQVHLIKNANIKGKKPEHWRKTASFKLTLELILFNRETTVSSAYCFIFILIHLFSSWSCHLKLQCWVTFLDFTVRCVRIIKIQLVYQCVRYMYCIIIIYCTLEKG